MDRSIEESPMSEIAVKLITEYIENWGTPREKRIEIFNRALKEAGIEARVYIDDTGTQMFLGPDDEMKKAVFFRYKICSGNGGQFSEREQRIDDLITEFKAGKFK